MTDGFAAGWRYGALAFLIGAVLGPVRELALAPLLGGLIASLLEAAAMVPLLVWAARRAGRHLPPGDVRQAQVGMALLGVGIVLAAEVALVLLFDLTGLGARRASRGGGEQFIGALLLAWLAAQPFRVRRG